MLMAVFRIMGLRLWRDKGALVLAFILPGFIFAIFAAIFSNAAGGNLDLRVSMALVTEAPATQQLAETLQADAPFSLTYKPDWDETDIRERVRLGQDDVGLVLGGDIAPPPSLNADSAAPAILIIKDPSREVAATVLMGHVRQILADNADNPTQFPALFSEISALKDIANSEIKAPKDPSVTYYIGATAILFLLFSAMQGASITLDERRSGISDRLLAGPIGAIALLSGKFLFLTVIGTVQAIIIVAVGHVFFDVPVMHALFTILVACVGSAALASGLALLVASLCNTVSQMNTVSTFAVLLFSALGGSMVPRFMMPEGLQTLGVFTPNYWSIEAFYGILARGQTVTDLMGVWAVLYFGAFLSLILAAIISHRLMRV